MRGRRTLFKRSVQNQSDMKANNAILVLDIIRDNLGFDISRADIAKITKMSATSITRITELLMNFQLVEETDFVASGTVGRKGINLQVVEDALITVGISIDSDFIDVCFLDFANRVIAQDRVCLDRRHYTSEEVVDIAYDIFVKLCERVPNAREQIKALGISCIGNVDYISGKVFFAPQFQWEEVELGRLASEKFNMSVFVDNDMKSSLVGLAHRKKGLRYEDVTYLSIGTGVGAAVMYEGKIVRGSDNAAGEVGHIILESSGRLCDCGATGCVQTYLTKNSLIEQCQEKGKNIQDVSEIYVAFRKGELWAKRFVDSQAGHLAMLIRNLVYMYNTRFILVGGTILSDFPELFDLAQDKIVMLLHKNLLADLSVQRVEERDNSKIGAAFVAQEGYLEQLLYTE